MQVSNQNNRINFTSAPLHSVNLKKITNRADDGISKAIISKLNPNDKLDEAAIRDVNKTWHYLSNHIHCLYVDFSKNFDPSTEYFAVETQEPKNLANKIIGLMQVCTQKSFITKRENLVLSTLATKPDFMHGNESRSLKNVGEALFGDTFSMAKEKNTANIKFFATKNNYKFYSDSLTKAGLNESEFGNPSSENLYEFIINEKSFDRCINYYQNKFCPKPSALI